MDGCFMQLVRIFTYLQVSEPLGQVNVKLKNTIMKNNLSSADI